jgi:hypothetical protein
MKAYFIDTHVLGRGPDGQGGSRVAEKRCMVMNKKSLCAGCDVDRIDAREGKQGMVGTM